LLIVATTAALFAWRIDGWAWRARRKRVGRVWKGESLGGATAQDRRGTDQVSIACSLLGRVESNDIRMVMVEDASRFAPDLVAQELGLLLLIKRDVRVLTANGDDLTDTTDPSRVMMRQIAGSFAQFEKSRLVTKLRGARERSRVSYMLART
jgi:DNA invertase Pin-like site-specific DNA recombinase